MSDSHADRSLAVRPTTPEELYAECPILAPCIVMLVDPVAALFVLRITLIILRSADKPRLKLPYLNPAVRAAGRLPVTPCPDWHRTDVSASHVVRSHTVLPRLVAPVYVVSPRFDPCTVILMDPVAAEFFRLVTLAVISPTEKPLVALPALCPAVTVKRWLPIELVASWHRSDVSDSHVVRSHVVTLVLKEAVYAARPRLAPCNVTLVDPDPTRFVIRSALISDLSVVNKRVVLPMRSPTDKTIRLLSALPTPTWHFREVSDAHVDRSQTVDDVRTADVYVVSPMFAPCNVTLADPVVALFVERVTLSEAG